jgi:hypothetical protein
VFGYDNNNNKFIPEVQRITFFMSKEPALRLVRQALIALAIHFMKGAVM